MQVHLDIALLKSLAQALPNLCQERCQRHRQSHYQEQLAHHCLLNQPVSHCLPTAGIAQVSLYWNALVWQQSSARDII